MKSNKGSITAFRRNTGQSLVEFALLLPLMVLVIVGIFDLGRAFFAYIAISNAAREGVRVFTFTPDKTDFSDILDSIHAEIGASTIVDPTNIVSIEIECADPVTGNMFTVANTTQLRTCKSEAPIQATIEYSQPMILTFFFPAPLRLVRSAEMMVP